MAKNDIKTPKEKAEVLALDGASLVDKSYTSGNLQITVTQTPSIDEFGRLVVWVSATRNGVSLDLDLPFIYVNPPIIVIDGTETVVDPVTGKSVKKSIYKHDPFTALKEIIAQTVDQF